MYYIYLYIDRYMCVCVLIINGMADVSRLSSFASI